MELATVVGHERVRETLRRALAHRSVHTGYLFTGPEGVGKRLVATEFARAFLCLEEGAEACGICRSCVHPPGAPHPDLVVVEPQEKKKSIGVDQVRELCSWLALSPSWGRRKAGIVDPADFLTGEAQNALLKTLEEPPSGRVILLVTSRPGALAPTVHSRCQKVPHGALSEAQVADVLRHAGWPAQTARQAAAIAEGSPGVALGRDGKAWQEAGAAVDGLLAALSSGDRGAILAFAEGVREGRDQAQITIQALLGQLRRAARQRLGVDTPPGEGLPGGVARLDTDEICRLMERAVEIARRLDGNANPRLALSTLIAGEEAGGRG